MLATQTSASDVIVLKPSIEEGNSLVINCPLGAAQQSLTATLNTVTSKNKGSNQALESTFTVTSGAVAVGQFLINSTHASRNWVATNPTGSTWLLTQPVQALTAPMNLALEPTLTEVDTWAHNDTIIGYTPIGINLLDAEPIITANDANLSTGLYIQNCNAQVLPGFSIATNTPVGRDVVFVESSFQGALDVQPGGFDTWVGGYNTFAGASPAGFLVEAYPDANLKVFAGGCIGNSMSGSMNVDYDFVFSGEANYDLNGVIGTVYIDTESDVGVLGQNAMEVAQAWLALPPEVYGPGSLGTAFGNTVQYPSGAGEAVDTFKISGGLNINGLTSACSHTNASPDVLNCGITLTAAHLDAAAGASGFGGNAFIPGLGGFNNL
jgi:hypothetical protein